MWPSIDGRRNSTGAGVVREILFIVMAAAADRAGAGRGLPVQLAAAGSASALEGRKLATHFVQACAPST